MPDVLGHGPGVGVMTGLLATRPKTRLFPGSADQVRHVRDFAARAVDGCPVTGDVVHLASELAANAIVHTASGRGGTFSVAVFRLPGCVRVEVRDRGSAKTPVAHSSGHGRESGRGLALVAAIAARWGHYGGRHGRVVWFEVEW